MENIQNLSINEIKNNILDFSIDNSVRIKLFKQYLIIDNENNSFDFFLRICGIYQFSGIKILENFLQDIIYDENISSILRLKSSENLINYYELEDTIEKYDSKDEIEIKIENNKNIKLRNEKRKEKGFETLNNVCKNIDDLPVQIRVEAILLLMEIEKYTDNCDKYFRLVINDQNIDCDYRYKIILSLETKKINNYLYYIKNACLDFLNNIKNMTMYRILAGQYLLQNCEITNELRIDIQEIILSFAKDEQLDYNLRADAADLILNLGSEKYKLIGREIITYLGLDEGNLNTIYNNKQNVHVDKIEESVLQICKILLTTDTMKIEKKYIDYTYVKTQIEDILKEKKEIIVNAKEVENIKNIENVKDLEVVKENKKRFCKYCNIILYTNNEETDSTTNNTENNNNVDDINITDKTNIYCSNECEIEYIKENKIRSSLNRIFMDRSLYLGSTLSIITVKIWSYIQANEFKSEMIKRLFEELEEMSGTCASGFLSRLVNCLSGFGELQITISIEDQLIANFIGRLNAYSRKILNKDSPFYNEKLYDILELLIYENNIILERRLCKQNKLNKETQNIELKKLIDSYLEIDRDEKIENAVEIFSENVINEMTINVNKYADRRYFSLFFRTYLPNLRQELYEEFRDFMTDFEFDLCIRKAISTYEGLTKFI